MILIHEDVRLRRVAVGSQGHPSRQSALVIQGSALELQYSAPAPASPPLARCGEEHHRGPTSLAGTITGVYVNKGSLLNLADFDCDFDLSPPSGKHSVAVRKPNDKVVAPGY
ncbi:unnamed protein product [Diplocarpon coronariae]|nr:hypothetical protein JHW43_008909 [Diplocarpon mali]